MSQSIKIIFDDETAYDQAIQEAKAKAWYAAAEHLEGRYEHAAAAELWMANPYAEGDD